MPSRNHIRGSAVRSNRGCFVQNLRERFQIWFCSSAYAPSWSLHDLSPSAQTLRRVLSCTRILSGDDGLLSRESNNGKLVSKTYRFIFWALNQNPDQSTERVENATILVRPPEHHLCDCRQMSRHENHRLSLLVPGQIQIHFAAQFDQLFVWFRSNGHGHHLIAIVGDHLAAVDQYSGSRSR